MTKLTEFLSPENIQQGVLVSSKKRVLELIGKVIAKSINQAHPQLSNEENSNICPVDCFSNLFKREKLGTTGLNQGIALPHAKLPACESIELDKPIAVFLQLEEAIDYEAQDNKEVDLIYAIMFPENSCKQYKNCLPQIAQQLTDKSLLKQLRAANSVEDIWQILMYADNHTKKDEE
ncbi:PTS system, nitrogen regulatory IIA-like protein [Mannheimia varigena USDA-ARS-USMARC-1296]|uniref:PTS system, nitrogen regulatory IIA-like protein n=1 Tax=Mannheimia varigena USDA-ARS-USMARC-1296 TaxID=1433287 RepID=W0QCU7_9PAST|nr:PTS sugar transporter subunit IIA [Mannheimia varigena]AHG76122.1 PTS system, nitrogen regulatory IIA-like protein [Mannheimia varigena USDA-ARS-USMARC-1296]